MSEKDKHENQNLPVEVEDKSKGIKIREAIETEMAHFRVYLAGLKTRIRRKKTKQFSHRKPIGKDKETGADLYGDYIPIGPLQELLDSEHAYMIDWDKAHAPVFHPSGKIVATDGVFKLYSYERFKTFVEVWGVSPNKAIDHSIQRFYSAGAHQFFITDKGNVLHPSNTLKIANIEAYKKGAVEATGFAADTYGRDHFLNLSDTEINEIKGMCDHFFEDEAQASEMFYACLGLAAFHLGWDEERESFTTLELIFEAPYDYDRKLSQVKLLSERKKDQVLVFVSKVKAAIQKYLESM